MERSTRRLCTLLAMGCMLASLPALSDSIPPQDYRVPAEIAGDPCRVTDPSDPHQILGPNPAHANCLTALYPGALPSGNFASDVGSGPDSAVAASPSSMLGTGTVWLIVTAIAMLVLAGFNSRKRHRQLPMPSLGGGGTISPPRESFHSRGEGSRWHED